MTTITVSLTGSTAADLAAISAAATAALVPAPSPPAPPPVTESWVYHEGKLIWGGDWSYSATPNYDDTANLAPDGTASLRVTLTGAWGGWQPYINAGCQSSIGECFDTSGFNYLNFLARPTIADQKFKAAILSSGDTADGPPLYDMGPYNPGGDNPPVGVWTAYKVPLSVFALTNPIILKFSIGDQTGLAANAWNLANVGFSAT
jgi:hypothetical protein